MDGYQRLRLHQGAQRAAEADRAEARIANLCHADRDGDCTWAECPQLRVGEPAKSGRHCPLDAADDEP